jgi:hypothetical protein
MSMVTTPLTLCAFKCGSTLDSVPMGMLLRWSGFVGFSVEGNETGFLTYVERDVYDPV